MFLVAHFPIRLAVVEGVAQEKKKVKFVQSSGIGSSTGKGKKVWVEKENKEKSDQQQEVK